MNEADTRAELIEFCRHNGRVCPLPLKWNQLYQLLPETRRVGNGWEPALPLILAVWHFASNSEKQTRHEEHIRWAEEHGSLEKVSQYLLSLDESDWHHLSD